jgi:hypothetical protein
MAMDENMNKKARCKFERFSRHHQNTNTNPNELSRVDEFRLRWLKQWQQW